MNSSDKEVQLQRQYYSETAQSYDTLHLDESDEHFLALNFLVAMLDFYGIKSILDVGSGTGRVLSFIKAARPEINVIGIEPVESLRCIGYQKGLLESELIDGDATCLPFDDGAFDLVCEFGVLHHIKRPERAVAEMLRVAGKAIFISDCNNFGQGRALARFVKQVLDMLGLWKVADLIKTKGKGYSISEGDGLAYSYSVFNNYRQIRATCEKIHFLNNFDSNGNLYRSAAHLSLLGLKK